MNFGKWIIVAFVLFVAFIGTLATICIRQDVPLVSNEYYKEELAYQDQIARIQNANDLAEKPVIFFDKEAVTIQYSGLPSIKSGELRIVRPSDASLDQVFDIHAVDGPTQQFALKHAVPGMYRAKLMWEQEGKQYFIEKVIVL